MKVLFPIGTLYPSQEGGPSNTIYWMAKALTKNHVKVTCISTSFGVKNSTFSFDSWHDTDYGTVIYTREIFHPFPFKLIFRSILEARKNEIIHLTSLFYLPSIIMAFVAKIYKKNIVWSVRGTLETSAILISPVKKRLAILFIKLIRKNINFHSTSPSETSNILKYFGKDSTVVEIPNYLELPLHETRVTSGGRIFLFLGRLHEIKAIDKLIMALSICEGFLRDKTAILKVVGEGNQDYTDFLKTMVKKFNLETKILFVGHVEGIEKEKLLAEAYFTILPSHSENFSNVVLESLAQSTPVIASTGTPWQILEEKKCGFWVENSAESLAKTIDYTLQMNNVEYALYRKQAKELVIKKFDVYNNIEKWINIYKKL